MAVLRAANTSLGVALLTDLVERAARVLGPEWDVEILDLHHRMKADAPSGTALALGEAAARGRSADLKAERGRDGTGLKRVSGAVGFAALRGGTAQAIMKCTSRATSGNSSPTALKAARSSPAARSPPRASSPVGRPGFTR